MTKHLLPFNLPWSTGNEASFILELANSHYYAGAGEFSKRCEAWLESLTGCKKALLTPSCTAALEMTALLIGITANDEVIMPSYTFVSTANAFVLRGAKPVFVDIRLDTLNIDESLIEAAITPRTKAIVVMHYAGTPCEMTEILAIAKKYGLFVIEDAAHAIGARYKSAPAGSMAHLSAFSFHQSKNIHCGEGGALLINDERFIERAHILQEKGTNRSDFISGKVQEYTWVDIGQSQLLNEISAAFLWGQLQEFAGIHDSRLTTWNRYQSELASLASDTTFSCPTPPPHTEHNAHIYPILMNSNSQRSELITFLEKQGIQAATHYVPLHESPAGRKFCRSSGILENTTTASSRSLRLPLWTHMPKEKSEAALNAVCQFFSSQR